MFNKRSGKILTGKKVDTNSNQFYIKKVIYFITPDELLLKNKNKLFRQKY